MGILRKTALGLFFLAVAVAGPVPGDSAARTPVISSQHKHNPQAAHEFARPPVIEQEIQFGEDEEESFNATGPEREMPTAKITARSAIVLDAVTGEAIYAVSPDLAGQPASTIKVLTGLLAITTLKNQEKVAVSKRAAGMPRSKIYLQAGKSYTANDLINAVLLSSANDASVALAEKIGGSEQVFASLMTHRARQLGAVNTVCKTANGLTAPGQQSTARDLAIIFNEIMKNEDFADRIRKIKVQTSFGKELRNHNRALWELAGAEGGKTGFTQAAKQTYVGKFRRGNNEMLVALMGSQTMWNDVRILVEHGFSYKESLAAANSGFPQYSADLLRVKQLDHNLGNPLLVVLTGSPKTSHM
jgi:D-alanyl-D-alanine carboxypeptidase